MKANYSISIDGADVSSAFGPVLESMTLTDSDGGKSDTLDIVLNDMYGQISLPRVGAAITAAIWWEEVPDFSVGGAVRFSGKTDEPKSHGSRHHGLTLSISAKSADLVGKGKQKLNRHKDKTTFGKVAQEWGQIAGYQVQVESSLSSIQRDYWAMHNESFLNWGRRVAREIGATFKCAHPKAAFVPRNSGNAASGAALSPLIISAPGNLISWDVTPVRGHGVYANAKAIWYDPKAAKWMIESQATGLPNAKADFVHSFKSASKAHAKNKATAAGDESQRKAGGGSFTLCGDPRAISQNDCSVSGARQGVDGSWRIKTAHHTYSRGGGWGCSVDVEQPQGSAGKDSR